MSILEKQRELAGKLIDHLQEQGLFDMVNIYVGDECWGDSKTYQGEIAEDAVTPGGTPYKWAPLDEMLRLVLTGKNTWLVFMFAGKAYHKLSQVIADMSPICREYGTEISRVSTWVALVYAKEQPKEQE